MNEKSKPVDKNGRGLKVGDKIRVTGFHPGIADRRKFKTRTILEQCVGRVFRISDFQRDWTAIDVGKLLGRPDWGETIYLEPAYIELVIGKKRRTAKSRRS